MSYITENAQDAVVESVLLTTEKTCIASEGTNDPDNIEPGEMVYFQIED